MSETVVGLSEQDLKRIEAKITRERTVSGRHTYIEDTALLLGEVRRLRAALAEAMVPIEVLAVMGDDVWELAAPELRERLITARTLGRAALFGAPSRVEPAAQRD